LINGRSGGPVGRPASPCRYQWQSEKSICSCYHSNDEKLQLIKRLPAPLIRHLLASHRHGKLSAIEAARELGLSRPRFYKLYSQYLRAYENYTTAICFPLAIF
ncbi:MAG TPA: hypothetical protein VGJ73_02170, partial [Verrucomicrobiae bacterium]